VVTTIGMGLATDRLHVDVVDGIAGMDLVRSLGVSGVPTVVLDESMPMTIWAGDWYHLRVRDGRVLLLWPDDPVIDDDAWLAAVLEKTRTRMPCLRDIPLGERWSGLYEMSPDGHALLGRTAENRYVANGSSGHGVMHAPALGQLLAELIVDGQTSLDISALRPDRFERDSLDVPLSPPDQAGSASAVR